MDYLVTGWAGRNKRGASQIDGQIKDKTDRQDRPDQGIATGHNKQARAGSREMEGGLLGALWKLDKTTDLLYDAVRVPAHFHRRVTGETGKPLFLQRPALFSSLSAFRRLLLSWFFAAVARSGSNLLWFFSKLTADLISATHTHSYPPQKIVPDQISGTRQSTKTKQIRKVNSAILGSGPEEIPARRVWWGGSPDGVSGESHSAGDELTRV